jgi:uncharacterized membrane protein
VRTALDALIVLAALGIALWLRPWRALVPQGAPWLWFVVWGCLPVLWTLDRIAPLPVAATLSCASLLVLLAGWPLAIIAMAPVALVIALATPLPWAEVLDRLAWLGVVPATLALLLGAAVRRWLPQHLFVYILGRGFFGTFIAVALAAWLASWLHAAPPGLDAGDVLLGRVLSGFGEAFLTGMLTAMLVAFRPEWLATYSDRLYLPAR